MVQNNLILIFSLIFIGHAAKRSQRFPDNAPDVLNKYILNVALPAMILLNVPKLPSLLDIFYPMLIHWSALIIHVILILILGKFFLLSRSVVGVLIVVSSLGNTAFLGIPMVKSLIGHDAIVYAVIYDQLGSGIGFILYGAFLIPLFTNTGQQYSMRKILTELLTFPAFIALVIGLLIRGTSLPQEINMVIENISATLIPIFMFTIGLQMKFRHPFSTLKPLGIGLFLKLICIPLITLSACKLLGWSSLPVRVSIIQSGMPPMVVAGAMAIAVNLEKQLAAALVGYGLVLSFITLPLIKLIM